MREKDWKPKIVQVFECQNCGNVLQNTHNNLDYECEVCASPKELVRIKPAVLVEWCLKRSDVARRLSQANYVISLNKELSDIDKEVALSLEQYFDGVADAFKLIAEGECKQLLTRLKEVKR